MLEGAQRRATKIIISLRNLSYDERLKRLGMFSLRCRGLEGDMTELFKMIQDIDKVNLGKLFIMDEDRRTRRHDFCLKIKRHVSSNIEFLTRSYKLLEPTLRCSSGLQILGYIQSKIG